MLFLREEPGADRGKDHRDDEPGAALGVRERARAKHPAHGEHEEDEREREEDVLRGQGSAVVMMSPLEPTAPVFLGVKSKGRSLEPLGPHELGRVDKRIRSRI